MEQLQILITMLSDYRTALITGLAAIVFLIFRKFAVRFADDAYNYLKGRVVGRNKGELTAAEAAAPPSAGGGSQTREETPLGSIRIGNNAYTPGNLKFQGDLCSVYEATADNRGAGKTVILKIARRSEDNDLLYNEARILKILWEEQTTHLKHLPHLLDEFKSDRGKRGNVLEYLDGYDLHAVREKYPDGIPQRHIIWIFRRSLSVVGYAHSRGIIHGNIEPAHILIRPHDHNVFLIDWSYAVHRPAESGEGFRALNEIYSAPEVRERRPPLPAADLYSLGKCMVFLLGGDPATNRLPESVEERIRRFIEFFLIPSAPSRAQDAWEMYGRLDKLREEVFGPHKFVEFKM